MGLFIGPINKSKMHGVGLCPCSYGKVLLLNDALVIKFKNTNKNVHPMEPRVLPIMPFCFGHFYGCVSLVWNNCEKRMSENLGIIYSLL